MRRASALSSLRALPGGFSLFAVALFNSVAEYAAWVAVLILAFEAGGAAESGRAVIIQTVPAAIAAPLIAAAGDRFPRDRVIQAALLAVVVTTGGIALLLRLDQPLAAVYAMAAVLVVALIGTPSVLASMLVSHARTPDQLTSLNALTTMMYSAGVLIGPLLAAAAIAVASITWLFAGLAVMSAATLAAVVILVEPDDRPPSTLRAVDVARDSIEGVRYTLATSSVRTVIGFLTVGQVVLGALDVIFVSVAYDQLGRGGSVAATISACLAAGAVLASVACTRLVGRVRLSTMASLGAVVLVAPVIWLDRFDDLLPVAITAALIGVGSAIGDIGALTLLQRAGSERMTSRVFGVYNSGALAACALGGLIAGFLLARLSTSTAFAVIGGVGLALVLLVSFAIAAVDRRTVGVDQMRIDELRAVSIFLSLPLPTLERLARTAERRRCQPGETLIAEGAAHDREFYVLVRGEVTFTTRAGTVRTASAPDFFGEIALVRDVARTATVVAGESVEVIVIERELFLESIALTASSRSSAESIAAARLAASATDDRDDATGSDRIHHRDDRDVG